MPAISVDDAKWFHDRIIETTGGLAGVRDAGVLESAINKPFTHVFGVERYKSDFSKSAAVLEAIAIYHPFVDGNKRTAMAMAVFFLYAKDIAVEFTNEEYEIFMVEVVTKRLTIRQISNWLKKHSQH